MYQKAASRTDWRSLTMRSGDLRSQLVHPTHTRSRFVRSRSRFALERCLSETGRRATDGCFGFGLDAMAWFLVNRPEVGDVIGTTLSNRNDVVNDTSTTLPADVADALPVLENLTVPSLTLPARHGCRILPGMLPTVPWAWVMRRAEAA